MFAADHGRGASGTSGDARQFPDVLLPVALWIEKESIYDSTERQHQLVQKEFTVHGTAKMDGYRL